MTLYHKHNLMFDKQGFGGRVLKMWCYTIIYFGLT